LDGTVGETTLVVTCVGVVVLVLLVLLFVGSGLELDEIELFPVLLVEFVVSGVNSVAFTTILLESFDELALGGFGPFTLF
jgi:hypothetical protein